MSGRMGLQSLSVVEEQVLAALCGLADDGKYPTGIAAAERTGRHGTTVYQAIQRLKKKGWIERDVRRKGIRNPVVIVARPKNIEKRFGYTPAQPDIDDHRHPDDRPRTRKCLTCRDDFASDGFGNRCCRRCKNSNAADGSWMSDMEARLP